MSPFPAENTQSDEIDISGFGLALLNSWRLIVAIGAFAALLNVLFTYFSSSITYEASTKILVENKGRKAVGGIILVDSYPLEPTAMATEVGRIASYEILKSIIIEMDLVNDPEFGLGINSSMKADDQYAIVYGNMLNHIEVENRKESNLIKLDIRSKSPAKALRLADAIIENYLAAQSAVFFQAFSGLNSETDAVLSDPAWLLSELEGLKNKADALQVPNQLSQLETIQELESISDTTILLYAYYLSTYEEHRYGSEFKLYELDLFSDVIVPPYINNPDESVWSFNAIISSLFFGLLAGCILVLARTAKRGRLCTESYLNIKYGLPVIATLTPSKPETQAREIATLRDQVIFSGPERHCILVLDVPSKTSQSTLSLPLATRFAAAGKKTLVISAATISGIKDTFADQELTKDNALEAAIVPADGFDVLQVAHSADDARDIFPSTAFSTFLNRAQESYDVVIFAAEESSSAQIITPLHRMSTAILLNCDAQKTYERDFLAFLRNLPVQTGKISCVFWR